MLDGTVNLPSCSFNDVPGVYVKHSLCGWANDRCSLTSQERCQKTCWLINALGTDGNGFVHADSLIGTSGMFSAAETRLCTTTTNPNEIDLPACPFNGTIGDIWVKPAFFDLGDWNSHACKVGENCNKTIGTLGLNIAGLPLGVSAGKIETKANTPGEVYAYMEVSFLGLSKRQGGDYTACIVNSSD